MALMRRLRRHSLHSCSARPAGRARIGWPASQRSRSSATSRAEAYRRFGSFSRHFGKSSRGRGRSIAGWCWAVPATSFALPAGSRAALLPETAGARQDRVQNRSQTVNVGGLRDRSPVPRGLLGGHVGWCSEHGPGLGELAVTLEPAGEPEVGHQRLALFVDQDIRRFQVAVEDASLVGVVDGPGYIASNRAAARLFA